MRTVLSLFSGIAGLCELGIAEAGLSDHFQVTQFVERNTYCQRVLRKHFSSIPIHDDIKTFAAKPRSFDVVCGGFPCQPFSAAGSRKGSSDDRHLWPEVIRVIRGIRPKFFLGENVPGLLSIDSGRVFGNILSDLAASGYCVEWSCISCAEVGGVHLRERVFVVAYLTANPQGSGRSASRRESIQRGTNTAPVGCCTKFANTDCTGLEGTGVRGAVANDVGNWEETQPRICRSTYGSAARVDRGHLMTHADLPTWLPRATDTNNIPHRRERLEALGNAVVSAQAAIAWRRVAYLAGLTP